MHIQVTEPFILVLCVFIYIVFTRRLKIPPVRWLLLVGFAYLSIRHVRYEQQAAVFVPLILAVPLGQLVADAQKKSAMWRLSALQSFGLLGMLGVLTVLRMVFPFVPVDGPVAPFSALAHVPLALREQPVLNSYNLGGLMIFKGIRPIIDGRADMYGEAFMKEHGKVMGGDKALLQAWSREFGLQWACLRPTENLINVLDADPQWTRLYTDRYAIVYRREVPSGSGL